MIKQVTVDWGESDKPPDERKRWMGAWLVSRDGEEGEYFYDGPGGVETAHEVPSEAVGFRLRWWPPADAPASLAIGPIATLAEDYFFPEGPEQQLSVKAMSLVR
jgi:hypothetical protein